MKILYSSNCLQKENIFTPINFPQSDRSPPCFGILALLNNSFTLKMKNPKRLVVHPKQTISRNNSVNRWKILSLSTMLKIQPSAQSSMNKHKNFSKQSMKDHKILVTKFVNRRAFNKCLYTWASFLASQLDEIHVKGKSDPSQLGVE